MIRIFKWQGKFIGLISPLFPFIFALLGVLGIVLLMKQPALAQETKARSPMALVEVENYSAGYRQSLDALAPGADISVTKSHATRFFVGSSGTYTITVRNMGDADFTGSLTLSDTLPNGLSISGCIGNDWTCPSTGSTGDINFNYTKTTFTQSYTSKLVYMVTRSGILQSQYLTNTVSKQGNTDDNLSNDISKDKTDVSADLKVRKLVTPTAGVIPNNVVTYTLDVSNNGPNDTTNVILTDVLPSSLTYINSIPSVETYNPTTGVWNIGVLAVNITKTLVIRARVNDGTCAGNVVNTTEGLSSDLYDPVLTNNQGSATFSVSNTCVTGQVRRSDNTAALANVNVKLIDSASHQYTTSTNSSGYYTFTNKSAQPIVGGTATLTASATGFRTKTVTQSITQGIVNQINIDLDPIGELRIRKTNGRDYIVPGETFTYTIPITNVGNLPATALIITDSISSQFNFITYTVRDQNNNKVPFSNITFANAGGVYTWTLPSSLNLNPTERLTLTLRVSVKDPLTSGTNAIANTVKVRYIEDGTTRANKSAEDSDWTPNFSITQNSVSPTEAKVNERFTFSFVVYNNHPSVSATDVVFTNTFPSYLTYYSSSPSGSYNSSTRVFTVNLGNLNPSTSKSVSIVMTVNNAASSTQILDNTGSASFKHGGIHQWRKSNTVQYRVLGTSTLPGTGFGPMEDEKSNRSLSFYLVVFLSIILIGLGMMGILLGFFYPDSEWMIWARQMGVVVLVVGILFVGFATILGGFWNRAEHAVNIPVAQTAGVTSIPSLQTEVPGNPLAFQSYESLPDYPIPTPTSIPESVDGRPPDDSPPTRIMIPSLGLDTIVKYVPFDGFTWLISGLQNEIAWMGSTSWPGLGGNTALAGHVTLRNGADGPFRYLENLQSNDIITIFTEKNIYQYRVSKKIIVKDDDFSIVQPSDKPVLTLITCTGWNRELGHYLERLVVIADLEKVTPIATHGSVSP